MDTGLFPAERRSFLQAHRPEGGYVVLPFPSAGHQRPAAAHEGIGDSATTVWLRTAAHPAHSRGVAGGPKQGASAVQARGTSGSYESAPPQANQLASRSGPDGYGRWTVLGDGFCS